MLLMMRPKVIHAESTQIAFGLHDLLKTNAANIHSQQDWYTLFTLLEVTGAGSLPPPILQARSSVNIVAEIEDGARSDSDVMATTAAAGTGAQGVSSDVTEARGYASDGELYGGGGGQNSSSSDVGARSRAAGGSSSPTPGETETGSWHMVGHVSTLF